MPVSSETVTLAGSGLVFNNTYDAGVTDAYRAAVITAENFLQTHFVNQVTVGVTFEFTPLGSGGVAENDFFITNYNYATVTAALAAHATTADDQLAIAALPAVDPSGGLGFALTSGQAQALGLQAPSGMPNDDTVILGSNVPWVFGQDVVGTIEHEITEGVFGRNQDLGVTGNNYDILDLFRYALNGQHDYTGGTDGAYAVFGVDSTHLTPYVFHNSVAPGGATDGQDLGDWDNTSYDAFGGGGGDIAISMSPTDLRVLDVIGWTPPASPLPGTDDFASSLSDQANPFGHLTVGTALAGSIEITGDRDWFAVQLNAGTDYVASISGEDGGGGTLDDSILRLHDATGVQIATNDDANPDTFDSSLVIHPTTSGIYYVEVGSFEDATAGTYTVSVQASAPAATDGNDFLVGTAGGSTINAGLGNDTVTGGDAQNYLRGNEGDDVLNGGTGFDDINGNMGNDTVHGGAGDDYSVGGKDNDLLYGDAGNDIVWGNLGNDTCDGGSGNDQCRGGQGDDSISGGAGNDFISGDRGNDTESGGSGADTFHGSQDAGIDKVLDFNIAEGDRVELDPGTTYTVSQVGADTVIDMGAINGAPNQMILVGVDMATLTGNWIFLG
ncbi:MAG: NF038122 family metalloprotease [Phenylobacterium sp.]